MHRRDLSTLSSAERAELASLIRNYVTQSVIDDHKAWHDMHNSGGTTGPGSGEQFLTFHRDFVGRLENSLSSNPTTRKYTPLPKWNPATPIPPEFSHPGRNTDDPRVPLPSWATIGGGITPDPVFGYTSLRQFQSFDELGRALGSRYHGSVHNAVGGVMTTFRSPRDPIFFPWHAFLDDIWSQWEELRTSQPPVSGSGGNVSGNTSGSQSRCFIATAAYGSDLEPPVQFLRDFRDNIVLQSRFQKPFEKILDMYYSFSPPIADAMYRNKAFKYAMKYSIVLPFVALARTAAFLINPFVIRKSRP